MWAEVAVLPSPRFDDDSRLLQRVEDLAVQQLVAELAIERLGVTVLPGRAWFDKKRLGADAEEPLAQRGRDELRLVVAAHMLGNSPLEHQSSEPLQHILGAKPP